MSSFFNQIKKVRIILEFKGRNFVFEVAPYKTILFIKEQAKKHFFLLKDNLILVYQNKHMTNYEGNLIGDYFKGRSTIPFKLIQREETPLREKRSKDCKSKYEQQKCPCEDGYVEYYCRICKEFICNKCRTSSENHLHNLVLQINTDNPIDNIKVYAKTLQEEIKSNIKSTITHYQQFQNKNFIEVNARQEMFLRKLNKVHSLYKQMMSDLTATKGEDKKIDTLIDEFQSNAQAANSDIEVILSSIDYQYRKGTVRMTYEEMKALFKQINERERLFEGDSCNALAYKLNYEINTGIDNMYNNIENIVDEYLNQITPLGLNSKSNAIYEMIKSKKRAAKPIINNYPSQLKQVAIQGLQIKDRDSINAKEYNKESNDNYDDYQSRKMIEMNKDKSKNILPLLTNNNYNHLEDEPSLDSNKGIYDYPQYNPKPKTESNEEVQSNNKINPLSNDKGFSNSHL